MKKAKIKLNHDELSALLGLIKDQILSLELKNQSFLIKSMIASLGEFYSKQQSKILFSYTGTRTVSLTMAQACAFVHSVESGFFSTENTWTRTILQLNHNRIHKQIAA